MNLPPINDWPLAVEVMAAMLAQDFHTAPLGETPQAQTIREEKLAGTTSMWAGLG